MRTANIGLTMTAFVLGLGAVFLTTEPGHAELDRNQLWNVVNLKCMRHLAKAEAPIPCDAVDISLGWDRGVAILKDGVGRGRLLAIATHPVSGIEDPAALADGEPNYFAVAWAARGGMDWRLRTQIPGEAVAVTVDSKPVRQQDQLHLIVDCLAPDVATTLAEQAPSFDQQWRQMKVPLNGRRYWARRLEGDLDAASPFRLLADRLDGAKSDMSDWSLALAEPIVDGKPAFVLLADRAEGGQGGRAHELQDASCAILQH